MNIGDVFFALRGDGGPLQVDAQKAAEAAANAGGRKFSKTFNQQLRGALLQGVGLGAGIGGFNLLAKGIGEVKDVIGDTITKAMDFERGMLNVNSISKLSAVDLRKMGDEALRMSGEFGQSADTMTKALYDISSSGFAGAQSIDVLRASAKAATAGLSTTAESAKGITAVLNAYGLSAKDADRVSDVMFQTVNRGVVTFGELSAEIGKTTALASPLGVSLEEVGAAIAVMTRHGLDAADATTQLNAIMSSMLKPSAEAAELAARLGLSWSAAGLKANGLAGSLSDMIAKTGGAEDKMATLLGDVRAIRGAFTLAAGSGKELNDELAIMKDASGATDEAFGIQSQSAAFKMSQATEKLNVALIKLGTIALPLVADAADSLSEAFDGLAAVLDLLNGQQPDTIEGMRRQAMAALDLANALSFLNPALKAAVMAAKDELARGFDDATSSIGDLEGGAHGLRRVLSTQTTPAVDDLAGAADKAGASIKTMGQRFDATWSALSAAAQGAADDIYGPLIRKDELAANKREQRAQREIIASGKSTRAEVADARARLHALQREGLGIRIEMAGRGELTKTAYAVLVAELQTQAASGNAEIADSARTALGWLIKLRAGVDSIGNVRVTITGGTKTLIGRPRAMGGPVSAGVLYRVNEDRTEWFRPDVGGTVLPLAPAPTAGQSGGNTYQVNVTGLIRARSPLEIATQLRRLGDFGVLSPRREPA